MKLIQAPERPKGLKFQALAVDAPEFRVQQEAGVISIFEVLGPDANTRRVSAALRAIGPRPVVVEINSIGGDVFEAIGIYNALRLHGHRITVRILGIAASGAALVAMAGDQVEIARNGELMIHRAHVLSHGNAADHRAIAEVLDKIDAAQVETFAERTRLPARQLAEMLAAETFLSAAEAVSLGFADAILDQDAKPKVEIAARATVSSQIALEQWFRSAGASNAFAKKLAAAAWPEIAPRGSNDLEQLSTSIRAGFADLINLAKGT